MNKELLSVFRRKPLPYETTDLVFWDDEHISRSLLSTHLAPDVDGASRRHSFIVHSAGWIASLAPTNAHLLDIGCGPGLYAQQFYDNGMAVTGMDFSTRSIQYAEEQAKCTGRKIDYHYQNYLTMEYSDVFDVVVLIYCDYGALAPVNREILLQKVLAALKPGGLFVLDAYTPEQYADFQNSDSVRYQDGGFWSPLPYLCLKRELVYSERNYLEQYTVVTKEECRTYNLWNHAFMRDELEKDLAKAGFVGAEFYGDVAGAPMQTGDKTICVVAVKGR